MARKEVKSIKTILYIAHYYLFKTKLNLRLATSTCQNSFWSNHRIFENSNIRKEIKRVSENHFLSWTQHLFVKTVGDQADHTHYSKLHLIKHTILSKKKKSSNFRTFTPEIFEAWNNCNEDKQVFKNRFWYYTPYIPVIVSNMCLHELVNFFKKQHFRMFKKTSIRKGSK